jgi:hypothetical protein
MSSAKNQQRAFFGRVAGRASTLGDSQTLGRYRPA